MLGHDQRDRSPNTSATPITGPPLAGRGRDLRDPATRRRAARRAGGDGDDARSSSGSRAGASCPAGSTTSRGSTYFAVDHVRARRDQPGEEPRRPVRAGRQPAPRAAADARSGRRGSRSAEIDVHEVAHAPRQRLATRRRTDDGDPMHLRAVVGEARSGTSTNRCATADAALALDDVVAGYGDVEVLHRRDAPPRARAAWSRCSARTGPGSRRSAASIAGLLAPVERHRLARRART